MSNKPVLSARVDSEVYDYLKNISKETGYSISKVMNDALLKAYEIQYEPEEYIFPKKM